MEEKKETQPQMSKGQKKAATESGQKNTGSNVSNVVLNS